MFVTHLECAACGKRLPADRIATVCPDCSKPLWVRYDLDRVRDSLALRDWNRRPAGMWRYRELLPLPDGAQPVSLGETETPLLAAPRLAAEVGLKRLWIKDESRLPTASFKARGLAAAVTMAKHFGVTRIALPSAGNAAGAAAAYGARAGMEVNVFLPRDAAPANIKECALHGAKVHLVDGLISDCGRIVAERQKTEGWFNPATLREPYRIEGKKTMGLELADQFAPAAGSPVRCLPDVIVYPTGGGTGLIGFWKAFAELRALGGAWSAKPRNGTQQPRLYAVQAEGCAPIVRAYDAGKRHAEMFPNAATAAGGLRVPAAIGDFMILDAVRDSGGSAVAGAEADIRPLMAKAAALEGLALCPESAVALSGLRRLVAAGAIGKDEDVLLLNCASALKYLELI